MTKREDRREVENENEVCEGGGAREREAVRGRREEDEQKPLEQQLSPPGEWRGCAPPLTHVLSSSLSPFPPSLSPLSNLLLLSFSRLLFPLPHFPFIPNPIHSRSSTDLLRSAKTELEMVMKYIYTVYYIVTNPCDWRLSKRLCKYGGSRNVNNRCIQTHHSCYTLQNARAIVLKCVLCVQLCIYTLTLEKALAGRDMVLWNTDEVYLMLPFDLSSPPLLLLFFFT